VQSLQFFFGRVDDQSQMPKTTPRATFQFARPEVKISFVKANDFSPVAGMAVSAGLQTPRHVIHSDFDSHHSRFLNNPAAALHICAVALFRCRLRQIHLATKHGVVFNGKSKGANIAFQIAPGS
jgi:hypothetical protein